MAWLQTTVPFATDPALLQEILYASSMAEAKAGRVDPGVALLSRSEEFKTTYLL